MSAAGRIGFRKRVQLPDGQIKAPTANTLPDLVEWLTRLEKGRGNPGAGSNPAVCRKAALCFYNNYP